MSSLKEIEAVLNKIRQEKHPSITKGLVDEILAAEANLPEHPAEAMTKIQEAVEKFLASGGK